MRRPGILRAGNKSSPAKPGPNGPVRRRAASLELVSLSGADPLNLMGIVTPGNSVCSPRVRPRCTSGTTRVPSLSMPRSASRPRTGRGWKARAKASLVWRAEDATPAAVRRRGRRHQQMDMIGHQYVPFVIAPSPVLSVNIPNCKEEHLKTSERRIYQLSIRLWSARRPLPVGSIPIGCLASLARSECRRSALIANSFWRARARRAH
jgi:hypothetical protein